MAADAQHFAKIFALFLNPALDELMNVHF